VGDWKCGWENGITVGIMEVKLGEWNYSWENGSVAGRMEL